MSSISIDQEEFICFCWATKIPPPPFPHQASIKEPKIFYPKSSFYWVYRLATTSPKKKIHYPTIPEENLIGFSNSSGLFCGKE
jgi:hypothetical protein